ncbi:MAG: energy transducer TonB [Acidobacteriota bacterium]
MVAVVSHPVLPVLPDLPRDVSPSLRWSLIGGVVLVHLVVATLVVLTSRLPAVVADAAPISVSLLTQAPSEEPVRSAAPVVQPPQPAPVTPVAAAPAPAPRSPSPVPQVAAVAAPAQSHDMVVPVAPATVDRKAPADSVVTSSVVAPTAPSASGPAEAAVPVSTRPVQLAHTAVRYLRKVEPVFPKMSARLGEYGNVTVSVVVDDHGLPVSATVVRSSGYPRLDAAARDAVMQSRYVPYTLNGVPQRFEVPAPFSFTPPSE